MNIVFLCRLYSPHVGGVERHVKKLAELLSKNHQITIITELYSPELKVFEKEGNITIYRIPIGRSEKSKKWLMWKWIHGHQSILNKADVIHVHDVVYWLYPYKLLHPAKNIYSTFHGWEGIYPVPFKNILKKRLDAFISSAVMCIGDYISQLYGIRANIVSYGATDFKPTVSRTNKNLLFLGRLDRDTGFEDCIKYFETELKPLKYRLIVAGDGVLKNKVPSYAKYLGVVNDVEKVMAGTDLVFTTGYLGILEALRMKKIVLYSFSNPAKKLYLTTHPMFKQLTQIGKPLPKTPSQIGFNWASEQTWEKLVNDYLKLWQM